MATVETLSSLSALFAYAILVYKILGHLLYW